MPSNPFHPGSWRSEQWREGFAAAVLAAALAAGGCWLVQRLWQAPLGLAAGVAVSASWAAFFLVEGGAAAAVRERWWPMALRVAAAHVGAGVLAWLALRVAQPAGMRGTAVPWQALWLAGGLLLLLARHQRWRVAWNGEPAAAEGLRWALLIGLVPLCGWAYATPLFVGGADAKWYAYALADHLEQTRAGFFPAWTGEGAYMFNGAVHPYRTAPLYQNLGALLDWATGRTLGVFGVQHLIVLAALAGAALVAYVGFCALEPRRRWAGLVASAGLVSSPGWLGLIFAQEMYMSFVALPALALAGYALVRALQRSAIRDHVLLAVALGTLWYGHTPIALWSTLGVFAALLVAAVSRPAPGRAWAAAGVTSLLLAWLVYFQFQNIAEFGTGSTSLAVFRHWFLGSAAAAALALGRAAVMQRWSLVVAAGAFAGLTALGSRDLGAGLGLATLVVAGMLAVRPKVADAAPESAGLRRWCAALLLMLAGAGLVAVLRNVEPSAPARATGAFPASLWPGLLHGIIDDGRPADVQPGWVVWLAGIFALFAAALQPRRTTTVLATVALIFAALLSPFAKWSEQLWNLLPTEVLIATSGAATLRLMPMWVLLMVLAAFCAYGAQPRGWLRRSGAAVFIAGVLVAIWQVQAFNRRVAKLQHHELQTADLLRTEIAPLGIYPFNFLDLPPTFSHGVMDVASELRLLAADAATLQGSPAAPGATPRTLELRATPAPGQPWPSLNASLLLAPGERLRLTFDFRIPDPDGILILSGSRFYREYPLPTSGGPRAFGAGAGNSRDLVIWNSLAAPIDVVFAWATTRSLPAEGVDFARVDVRPDSLADRPIQLLGLVPLRVIVQAPAEGIVETPRRYIPGYVARRDGVAVEPVKTLAGQVGVPVPAGRSEVVVDFAGTPGFWRAFGISAAGWLVALAGLIACHGWNILRPGPVE